MGEVTSGAGTGPCHIIACVLPRSSVPRSGTESAGGPLRGEGAFPDSQNGNSEAGGGPRCWSWAGRLDDSQSTGEGQAGDASTQDGGGGRRGHGHEAGK